MFTDALYRVAVCGVCDAFDRVKSTPSLTSSSTREPNLRRGYAFTTGTATRSVVDEPSILQ